MKTLEILNDALINIKNFSQSDISEDAFQKTIAELKAILHKLKDDLPTVELKCHANEIISYTTLSQRTLLERFLIEHFGIINKYTWPNMKWKKKGKYVYDLDKLELKLSGLIYKVQNTENES